MSNRGRFYEAPADGDRRSAPAALRNRQFIADVLADWLPASGTVLELASGTGEHVVHFAERFRRLVWQPSDVHPDALTSIAAHRSAAGLDNILPPIEIDASAGDWQIQHVEALLSINMVHISPWAASIGLLSGASRVLSAGGPLILYGPWLQQGVDPAPSNLTFDSDLKRRDPAWGLRRVEDFAASAAEHGLRLAETRAMPANNLMLLFHRD